MINETDFLNDLDEFLEKELAKELDIKPDEEGNFLINDASQADYFIRLSKKCIEETSRRRKIQEEYNRVNNITPKTIIKDIGEEVTIINDVSANVYDEITVEDYRKLSKIEQHKLIEKLEKQMKEAAKNLEFEEAMQLRDIIFELKSR